MVGGWSSTGLFAGDSTQTVLGSMTNGSEVFSAFMKTRLLIKLNHSFILKTRTGAAPRDGREQSHWQEVFFNALILSIKPQTLLLYYQLRL